MLKISSVENLFNVKIGEDKLDMVETGMAHLDYITGKCFNIDKPPYYG